MFNLNKAIAEWSQNLARGGTCRRSDITELEGHLREEVEHLKGSGLTEEEAFLVAARRLGDTKTLTEEFAKINAGTVWCHRLFWMAVGILSYCILKFLILATSGACVWIAAVNGLKGYSLGMVKIASSATILSAVLFLIYSVAKQGGHRIEHWLNCASKTRMRRSLLAITSLALVLALVFLGRIFIPHITARTLGVRVYGEMAMLLTLFNLVWSVLLPGLLVLLIFRLRALRNNQLEM